MSGPISQLLADSSLFLLLAAIGIVLARGRVAWAWLAIAFGLFILEDFALSSAWGSAFAGPFDSAFNWEGELLALLILVLASVFVLRDRGEVSGLKLSQSGPAPARAGLVAIALCITAGAAAYWMAPGVPHAPLEEVAYRAGLSPLVDELFYRGLLLSALDRAFGRPLSVLGAPMGWGAVASAILFAASQSFIVTPGLIVSMDVGQGAYLFPAGLILAWLRNASGSLVMPLAVHVWASAVFYVL